MRENQAHTSETALILAHHLVVKGGIIQKKLLELEIEDPVKMTNIQENIGNISKYNINKYVFIII